MATRKHDDQGAERKSRELETLPELARRYGIGHGTLRRAAREGAFPLYHAGTSWPRVRVVDFERWLDSTRVPARPVARKPEKSGRLARLARKPLLRYAEAAGLIDAPPSDNAWLSAALDHLAAAEDADQ